MTGMQSGLLVAAGGFCGSIARYAISRWYTSRFPNRLPYGTLGINLLGSFLLGLLAGWGAEPALVLLLGTGFMGAFTTFSTFAYESIRLGAGRVWGGFFLYIGVSVTFGLLLALSGYELGTVLKS